MHIMCKALCLSESYHFLVLGFGFFQCFCGILKLNQFTHTTETHLLLGQKWSKQVHQTVKMFIQGQQEKRTNRENGFSKLGHWNCNLEVPHFGSSVHNGSRFNYIPQSIPPFQSLFESFPFLFRTAIQNANSLKGLTIQERFFSR